MPRASGCPILYVDAVPVRVDERGAVSAVGLLLRASDGAINRELVSGRVLYHERVRDALIRHIEKDLGPMALPQIPAEPAAVHRGGVLPHAGGHARSTTPGSTRCRSPSSCRSPATASRSRTPSTSPGSPPTRRWRPPLLEEMDGGHGVLLRQAMAHLGHPL